MLSCQDKKFCTAKDKWETVERKTEDRVRKDGNSPTETMMSWLVRCDHPAVTLAPQGRQWKAHIHTCNYKMSLSPNRSQLLRETMQSLSFLTSLFFSGEVLYYCISLCEFYQSMSAEKNKIASRWRIKANLEKLCLYTSSYMYLTGILIVSCNINFPES